jgi:hypothetical protein
MTAVRVHDRGTSSRREFRGVYNTTRRCSVFLLLLQMVQMQTERWTTGGLLQRCRKAKLRDPGIACDVNSWTFPLRWGDVQCEERVNAITLRRYKCDI